MKNGIQLLFTFILFFLVSSKLQAQQTWEWGTYGVTIDLPDDFRIINNDNNEFEATGEGMDIFMYIFEGAISLEDMKNATMRAGVEMGLQEWDIIQDVSTRGFNGKYIAGYLDGEAVLLAGLIDPNNLTNFFVVITFHDDDEVAESDAFGILNSLRRS